MKKESEELLAKEYIDKVECCDECFCEMFCIKNGLRKGREPYSECYKNVLGNLREKENTRIKDSRLICANEMREFVLRQMRNDNIYCANDFLDVIDAQPTVDAISVVRCKDCKYGEPIYDLIGLAQDDFVYCKNTRCICKLNWFCADGERKDSEKDDKD